MKKFLFTFTVMLMALMTVTSARAKEAYAVYSQSRILTFYYDDEQSSRSMYGSVYSVGSGSWTINNSNLDGVIFDSSFADYKPTSTANWFANSPSLLSVEGLEYLNTSEVTDMSSMFSGCSSLTSLDLRGFDTGKVTNMNSMFYGCSSLVTIKVGDGWTTAKVTNSDNMFNDCGSLSGGNGTRYIDKGIADKTYAHIDGGDDGQGYLTGKIAYAVYNSGNYFLTFYYDDNNLNRQSEGTVYTLGRRTWTAYTVETAEFKPSFADYKPTSTSGWFENVSRLYEIKGLEYLNTSGVTDMSSMFSGCSSLTSLDLRGFDTGQVTDMSNMFSGCSSLKTIRVDEGWKTSSVTSSDCMFDGCQSLIGGNGTRYIDKGIADKTYAHIDGGDDGQGYLTGKIAYAVYNSGSYYLTFYYDDNNLNRQSEGTVYTLGRRTWTAYTVETAEFKPSFADYKPTSTSGWFENVSRLYEIKGLEYLNTSEVTDMSSMFSGCSSLVELDLLGFETGKVTDMSNMFSGCSSLVTIIVGDGWNTSSVMASSSMFERCSNIIGGNGTRYNAGFTDKTYARVDGRGGQGYLTAKQAYVVYDSFAKILTFYYDLDISKNNGSPVGLKTWGFDIDRVEFTRAFADYKPTSTSHWFEGCSNLSSESIDGLQYLNTSEVTDMSSMFSGCSSLTSLDLSGFDTGKVTDMSSMFSGCSSLVTITVGDGWTTGSVTSDYGMFDGCQELKGGNGTVYNASYTGQTYARVDGRDGPGYLTAKEGIATGVGSVGNGLSSADAPMFNLQGQRVNDSYKGVVIQNGRKVLKK
jgi:surface protein